jgi:hypothetical protein
MEALCVLGVADKIAEHSGAPGRPETEITLADQFQWFASEECRTLRREVADMQGGNPFEMNGSAIKKEFPPCGIVNGDGDDDLVSIALRLFPGSRILA